jgi:hypothetical protein
MCYKGLMIHKVSSYEFDERGFASGLGRFVYFFFALAVRRALLLTQLLVQYVRGSSVSVVKDKKPSP